MGKYLSRLFAVFFLAAACITLETLCIFSLPNAFVARHEEVLCLICSVVTIGLFVASAFFAFFEKEVLYRATTGFFVLLLFVLAALFVCLKSGIYYVFGDEKLFRAYMRRAGAWMPLLFILFQFLQVIVLPVPAFVSTAAGVALFGATKAALCSFAGIVSGSIVAFFIGRKIGYKAVAWIVGKDALEKWLKKLKGKDNFILTAMFVLPLFPDDVLCFVAGLSTMTWQYFLTMIVLARIVGIAATCYSVDLIPIDAAWGIVVWIVLAVFVVAAFVFLYKNLDALNDRFKRRLAKEKREKKQSGDKRREKTP